MPGEDRSIVKGLEYAAASIEALEEKFVLVRAIMVSLVAELNALRAFHGLPPLVPADLIPPGFGRFVERRRELLDRIGGQRPNELKPWEAV